ncbi:hypothetical protein HMPREF0379_0488 [[Eubacterium] yurii subsp. margaretiae ATCC 43715]|nr:hypothetical protein HMPREF0379_0488 [[Eubacterium] yurii subsp. margaretiae ATCC 43715]
MNTNVKLSYLLGIFLGMSLTILFFIIFAQKNSVPSNINIQNDKLILENTDLKSQISQKDKEIEELTKKINANQKNTQDFKAKNDGQKSDVSSKAKVKLDIKKGMTNSEIADLLVSKGVYPHKNDLMMLMEMINFDRAKNSKLMQDGGYISSADNLNLALKEIETNQYALSDYLSRRGLVEDSASFMKVIYILDINNTLRYGVKEFETNSSLRQISDVLIN